jgi:glycosyltransferase involved in cell wall biosynthesis
VQILADPLRQLSRRYPNLTFTSVGAKIDLRGVECRFLPWEQAHESEMVELFDIGVMPLPETPYTLGKCGYKLVQYMAAGVPVVASPVGINRWLVRNGRNGFLASSTPEWVSGLERLLENCDTRHRIGARGRSFVERSLCTAVIAPRLARVLRRVAAERPRASQSSRRREGGSPFSGAEGTEEP